MSISRGPRRDDPPAAGTRRRARERTLGLLYEAETKGCSPRDVLAGLPVVPEPYAVVLVEGVDQYHDEIDALVVQHAKDWALDRMPAIDRQLLRVATFELLVRDEIPVAVILDEAVELAKLYSTEESSRFVNGVLAAVARAVRSEPSPAE